MTYILSDNPINSSRSAEIKRTPRPSSLASLNLFQIRDWAPISIPLVGCEAIRRLGLFSISLPTTNFC